MCYTILIHFCVRYKQQWSKGLRPQKYDELQDKNSDKMVKSFCYFFWHLFGDVLATAPEKNCLIKSFALDKSNFFVLQTSLTRLSKEYISWVQGQEGKTEEAFQVYFTITWYYSSFFIAWLFDFRIYEK